MASGDSESEAHDDDDEMEISDLRPRATHPRSIRVAHPHFMTQSRRRMAIGLGLVLIVAILLASQPFIRDPLQGLVNATLFPTPLPTATAIPTATPLVANLPTPPAFVTMPTALPGVADIPTIESAPASCGGTRPVLSPGGPPFNAQSIGSAPVLLGGFTAPNATLLLGPHAMANSYSWPAPYSRYGWPAPIGLKLQSGFNAPVTLSGRDLRTGYPLWFGFIEAGVWGAPKLITSTYTLDPAHPPVPAGGSTDTETFWYGYVFLPGAGCYTLAAFWPGGGWHFTISAGL
jgi:hypothetical protein